MTAERPALERALRMAREIVEERDEARAEVERLRDRLAVMNECVRTYVQMRKAGMPSPGWLEDQLAATDAVLNEGGAR